MKVLIAGASGFVGQRLINYYQQNNVIITAITRNPNQHELASVNTISWHDLNVDTVQEHDLIVNLAGTNIADKRWSEKRKTSIKQSRVKKTYQLSKLCAQLGEEQSPPLLNASAIGIYPSTYQAASNQKDETVTLDCINPQNFLMEVGCAWESATEPAIEADVRVVHMRFGIVLGPEGGMLKQLSLPFKLGLGTKLGNGQQTLSWISVEDLVRGIDFVYQQTNYHGPVNMTTPNPVSQKEFADKLAQHYNRPRWLTLPAKLARLGFGEMGTELLLSGQNVYPKHLQESGFKWQHAKIENCFKGLL